ncbi:hypothetical protein [Amycolatopsis sp. CA-230715]|uniref:hypothetical protein n=1 Tax=Amycolatopsis sp. CA-230715 TaxID=2745196 RepID=UPI001C0149A9|nr:hypothetical protein [Amycolatopsis sp. CA-230715]QWF79824.1 hypothetical protein HUW46_03237 [Amycolatopsis sp. CA-230715]
MSEVRTAVETGERVLPRQRQNAYRDAILDELAELASLTSWTRRAFPPLIHRAVLAGVEPRSIASSAGCDLAEAHLRWHTWADARVAEREMTLHEYLLVHDALARSIT